MTNKVQDTITIPGSIVPTEVTKEKDVASQIALEKLTTEQITKSTAQLDEHDVKITTADKQELKVHIQSVAQHTGLTHQEIREQPMQAAVAFREKIIQNHLLDALNKVDRLIPRGFQPQSPFSKEVLNSGSIEERVERVDKALGTIEEQLAQINELRGELKHAGKIVENRLNRKEKMLNKEKNALLADKAAYAELVNYEARLATTINPHNLDAITRELDALELSPTVSTPLGTAYTEKAKTLREDRKNELTALVHEFILAHPEEGHKWLEDASQAGNTFAKLALLNIKRFGDERLYHAYKGAILRSASIDQVLKKELQGANTFEERNKIINQFKAEDKVNLERIDEIKNKKSLNVSSISLTSAENKLHEHLKKLEEYKKLNNELNAIEKDLDIQIPGVTVEDQLDQVRQKHKICFDMDRLRRLKDSRSIGCRNPLEDIPQKLSELEHHVQDAIKSNPEKAIQWLKEEADKEDANSGHYFAKTTLAWCYSQGIGVEKNPEQTLKYYSEATGFCNADPMLKIAKYMKENQIDEYEGVSATEFEIWAKDTGHPELEMKPSIPPAAQKGKTISDTLKAHGLNSNQIQLIEQTAQKMLANKNISYKHESKKIKGNIDLSITKKDKAVYLHVKKLGTGASKTAKLLLDYQSGKLLARLISDSPEEMEIERNMLQRLKGMDGIVQIVSVSDIKHAKDGVILDYYTTDLKALKNKKIPLRETLELFHQVGIGLNNAHQRGICHRDIKPDNLLADYDPDNVEESKAVLADFNLAVSPADANFDKNSMMQAGTSGYIAPEIVSSASMNNAIASAPLEIGNDQKKIVSEILKRADVLSYGVSLQSMYYSPSFQQICDKSLSDTPQVPKFCVVQKGNQTFKIDCKGPFPAGIPDGIVELIGLINRMTDPDPWKRPKMEEVNGKLPDLIDLLDDDVSISYTN